LLDAGAWFVDAEKVRVLLRFAIALDRNRSQRRVRRIHGQFRQVDAVRSWLNATLTPSFSRRADLTFTVRPEMATSLPGQKCTCKNSVFPVRVKLP